MRRVLRDMRYLAADLVRRDMRADADRLLEITVQLPLVRQPEQIRMWRAELLVMQERLHPWPMLQDTLSIVLSQLRALEYNIEPTG